MKIAVNLLYLRNGFNSGIGKHIEDILEGFKELGHLSKLYLVYEDESMNNSFELDCDNRWSDVQLEGISKKPFISSLAQRLGKVYIIKDFCFLIKNFYLNAILFKKIVNNNSIGLVFYPFNDASIIVFKNCPSVTVIHDLFYKNYPFAFQGIKHRIMYFYVEFKHRSMLNRSAIIIALSEHAKSDILKHFPWVSADKLVVIPNAVTISGGFEDCEGIETPFLLSVAEHGIHKNHITLLKAYCKIKELTKHHLVLLGSEREKTAEIKKYIAENDLGSRVTMISNISDAKRNWLYANTDLYISPSLHEGFGRTPIEAAMLGAMVLTSRETSLPEVTMELLNYYEPATDENALAAKILYLLANPTAEEERQKIAEAYKEVYSPVRIAGMYNYLFCNLIQQNRSK